MSGVGSSIFVLPCAVFNIGSVPVAPLKKDERSLEEVGRRYPEAHPPPDFSDHGNIFQTRYQLFA